MHGQIFVMWTEMAVRGHTHVYIFVLLAEMTVRGRTPVQIRLTEMPLVEGLKDRMGLYWIVWV